MKSIVMSQFSQIWLPIVALLIFVSVFIVMLIHIFKKSSGKLYSDVELMPLSEGELSEKE